MENLTNNINQTFAEAFNRLYELKAEDGKIDYRKVVNLMMSLKDQVNQAAQEQKRELNKLSNLISNL